MNLKESLQKSYDQLPKMDATKCQKLCLSGECRHDCCGPVLCTTREKHLINREIKEKNIQVPFVNLLVGQYYALPNNPITLSCEYIRPEGCAIYEVRPAACRLFGACKEMMCPRLGENSDVSFPSINLKPLDLI